MRACVIIALGLAACSDGSLGAISVRWRVVDLTTGAAYDPRQQFGTQPPGGECYCPPASAPGGCAGSLGWRIDRVRVRIADPFTDATVTGAEGPLDADPAFVFNCQVREATTPFRVPPSPPDRGWAISLETFNLVPAAVDGGVGLTEEAAGVTPPPVVRTVRTAEITNLDVIQIGVSLLP
jgi:hypothetical protein